MEEMIERKLKSLPEVDCNSSCLCLDGLVEYLGRTIAKIENNIDDINFKMFGLEPMCNKKEINNTEPIMTRLICISERLDNLLEESNRLLLDITNSNHVDG